jgi:drug/metabolite transporter (DMT)-like permease
MRTIHPQTRVRSPRHFAAYAGMCVIGGSTFVFIRVGNEAVAPLWAATLRLVLAALALFVIAGLTGARLPTGVGLAGAAAFGLLNFGLNFALLYWGELTVPSGIAAVLYATIPLTTGIFAWAARLQPF